MVLNTPVVWLGKCPYWRQHHPTVQWLVDFIWLPCYLLSSDYFHILCHWCLRLSYAKHLTGFPRVL